VSRFRSGVRARGACAGAWRALGAWARVAALLAVLALLAPVPAAAADTIRVALVESARAAEVRGADLYVVPLLAPGQEQPPCERCMVRPWRADVVRAAPAGAGVDADGRRAAGFRVRSEAPIRVNGREYPGLIDLVRNGEGVAVVNEVGLEEYLVGVVRAEAPEHWPLEALKAQAIAARTYAAYQRTIGLTLPYHIVASTAHQVYAGRVPAASPAWTAVRETAGLVLLWEGEVFPAFYHSESGGFTEDPRTVFVARNLPALKPVRCEFSATAGSPHYLWYLDLRLADVSEALRRNGVAVGAVKGIEVAERTPSLRAAAVTVHGTGGSARLRGNDFRRMLGYETLKSTLFAVAIDGGLARFAGRGYGHGVGMCQWGAKGMADQGYRALQILEQFYPGTTLGSLAPR
jgi:stage II sporulation protein D